MILAVFCKTSYLRTCQQFERILLRRRSSLRGCSSGFPNSSTLGGRASLKRGYSPRFSGPCCDRKLARQRVKNQPTTETQPRSWCSPGQRKPPTANHQPPTTTIDRRSPVLTSGQDPPTKSPLKGGATRNRTSTALHLGDSLTAEAGRLRGGSL